MHTPGTSTETGAPEGAAASVENDGQKTARSRGTKNESQSTFRDEEQGNRCRLRAGTTTSAGVSHGHGGGGERRTRRRASRRAG